jgi:RNA polymerase sigma-70 factor (ECF subfamily)
MQEQTIIAQVKAGDAEGFGVLYDAYFEKIYSYLFYRIRDKGITEDLVSTTFFKAISGLSGFDERKGNFSAWLYRIARNSLYDHFRTQKITSSIEAAEAVTDGSDVEAAAIGREFSEKARKLLELLTPVQREIVTMRVWDDMSYKEIAAITGRSEASCKVGFHRAMAKLKEVAPLAVLLLIFFCTISS